MRGEFSELLSIGVLRTIRNNLLGFSQIEGDFSGDYRFNLVGYVHDKTHFQQTLKQLGKQIEESDCEAYYVADSALFTKPSLQALSDQVLWISRPPSSLKSVKQACADTDQPEMEQLAEGYFGKEVDSEYGGVKQRWLIVYSEKAYAR